MNILFICDEYPPGRIGGIGTVVQTLGRELAKQGHTVCVAGLYAHSFGGKDYEEDQGVKVWRLRYGWNLKRDADHPIHKFFNKIPGSIKQHLNGKKAFARFIAFINNLVETESIDIIELPDWNTFAMRIGFEVSWPAFKVPLLVKSHGSYTYFADEMKTPAKKWLRAIDAALYKRADALSAVSQYTANKNRQLFDLKSDIKILYNAIEPVNAGSPEKQEQTVIFTGTLIEKKGIFQLMKAWNLVSAALPNARLIIYGKGETAPLKKLLSPGAAKTVSFAGHVPRQQLFKELASASVAVFPSYSETFGLAAIEAMSAGCPVIFTKRASGPEIITDKVNGELIDPDNIEELSASIIRIVQNKDLQQHYAAKGKDTVDTKFNIVASAQAHIDYYSELIRQFKTKHLIAQK